MHGAGNDFVIIDLRDGVDPVGPARWPDLVRALGDRHRGVGFDQLAVLTEGSGQGADDEADVAVTFWNADGSTSAACGNATRCIAALLADEGRGPVMRIAVEGRGVLTAYADEGRGIAVDMGPPDLMWSRIPLARDVDLMALPLLGEPVAVGMGNPHCIYFVDGFEGLDWHTLGAATERDPLFPERTNVQFVQVLAPDRVRAKIWERGVGPTLASGSSACAIAVAAHRLGLTERSIAVELDGGTLSVDWRPDTDGSTGHVFLTGPVAHVFDGVLGPRQIAQLVDAGAAAAAPRAAE
ncbi:MAG: diaminopimelate epimerase [Pseudomonadota bacterium]